MSSSAGRMPSFAVSRTISERRPGSNAERGSMDSCCSAMGSGGVVVLDVPLVSGGDTVTQLDRRVPAERVDARGVEQFARHAIGLGGVPFDLTFKTNDGRHRLGEFLDR